MFLQENYCYAQSSVFPCSICTVSIVKVHMYLSKKYKLDSELNWAEKCFYAYATRVRVCPKSHKIKTLPYDK